MRSRNLILIFLFLIFGLGLLATASVQLKDINAARKELKLVSNEPLENAPPSLAFTTVAMGAFRGIVVDLLWMRAEKLKEEGQFFDAKQLAEWITIMQPRFAQVWDFQAWNMAYNISVAMPNTQPDERWKWVKNGYELLRDKGIVKNPNSISLYRSLAYIFQHKISGVTDDVNRYYKLQLALAMRPLVRPMTNEHFEGLKNSPQELLEVLADEQVAMFVDKLKSVDAQFQNDEKLVKNYLALIQEPRKFKEELSDVLDEFKGSDALRKFDFFAKAYELRNTWKFDIDLMVRLNEKYGPKVGDSDQARNPLNWEHPDVHAIYWAEKGLEIAGNKGVYTIEEVNTDRIVFHSLQNLFRTGQIYIYFTPVKKEADPVVGGEEQVVMSQTVFLRPDLGMFDSYNAAILERIKKYSVFDESNLRPLRNGHKNMLTNATLLFYMSGHTNKANEVFKELRSLYPREDNNYSLEVFCRLRIKDEFESFGINDATEMVVSLLREAYFRYALYQDSESAAREKIALDVYKQYQGEAAGESVDRVELADFSRMRYLALIDFLNDQSTPPNMKMSLLQRIKIERPELYESLEVQRKKFEKSKETYQQ